MKKCISNVETILLYNTVFICSGYFFFLFLQTKMECLLNGINIPKLEAAAAVGKGSNQWSTGQSYFPHLLNIHHLVSLVHLKIILSILLFIVSTAI